MTTIPAIGTEYEIGATGLLAVRLRSGDVRLRAVDGSAVRVHDTDGDLERHVQVESGDGSLSLRAGRIGLLGEGRRRGRPLGDPSSSTCRPARPSWSRPRAPT